MKKKTSKKSVLIILITLTVICLACGVTGLLASKKEGTKKPEEKNEDYKVTYRYYLDGEVVEEMPELDISNPDSDNIEDKTPKYKFERYACTNDVVGEFDEEKWEFVPELTSNTTCRLYFLNTSHEVTIKVTQGKLENDKTEGKLNIELESDGSIKVIPNDGHKYEGVTCNNEGIATYDEKTQELKISNVTKDTTCNISFTISDFTAEISVQNGNATESRKSANYGGTVTFEVTPSENYVYQNVTCTNNQKASYGDNKITITGLTNNTVCTVEFKPNKFQVKLDLINGRIKNNENLKDVNNGTVLFDIEAYNGYTLINPDIKCTNSEGTRAEVFGGSTFGVYNVTKDMECTVTLKKATEQAD